MKQYEREYFVSRIRSGFYIINHKGFKFKILPPTLEDEFESNQVYIDTFEEAAQNKIKTQEEMMEWMSENGFWTEEDKEKEAGFKKDLDTLRVEIFKARNNHKQVEQIRLYLRSGEEQLLKHISNKNIYQENTCEGLAVLEKSLELIRRCTYINEKPCSFEDIDPREAWYLFYNQICTDEQIRDITKSEPWRSIWLLKDSNSYNIFNNRDRELTVDQKNLLVWSRMYDNIHESPDCPSDDVIEDDDMLDGWFIIQKRKREKERAEAELDNAINNPRLQNASEVFLMAGDKNSAEKIDGMNDINGIMTKKERMAVIKQQGKAQQSDFRDEKLKLRQQHNQQFKDKFGR